jgi:hypothetical protein
MRVNIDTQSHPHKQIFIGCAVVDTSWPRHLLPVASTHPTNGREPKVVVGTMKSEENHQNYEISIALQADAPTQT